MGWLLPSMWVGTRGRSPGERGQEVGEERMGSRSRKVTGIWPFFSVNQRVTHPRRPCFEKYFQYFCVKQWERPMPILISSSNQSLYTK